MRGLLRATATGLSWPNAFNTGATITAPTPSVTVPTPTTSGTGWSYTSGTVTVTGTVTGLNITGAVVISGSGASLSNSIVSGSVTLSGANTALTGSSAASVAINASGCSVTGCSIPPGGGIAVANASPATGTLISNCAITQIAGTLGGIRLGSGPPNLATDTTIQDCTVSGVDGGASRAGYCINDNSAYAAGVLVLRCNLFNMRVGVNLTGAPGINITGGIIQDCYLHDFGYISGDHTDGVTNGGTNNGNLSILHNTMLMQLSQTSPLTFGGANFLLANVTIDSNLLAGGGYCIYAGTQGQGASDNDTGCGTNGTTTVTDSNAAAADFSKVLTNTSTANIPAFTTIIAVNPTVGYTLSASATGGTTTGQNFTVAGNTRTDTGCSTNGTTTVTDPHAVAEDYGEPISGPNIPLNTLINAVNTTLGQYTISNAVTGSGSALTFIVRQQAAASRTDTSCTTQTGGSATTVLDGRAQLYDLGATITGPNIPQFTTITAVT